ncbi:hypothetical protein [Uliginosibacterium gangwonense]|uniref:hypothetical protein n=1 Tax=Uliginosibacterium gangwonense TaxID=392736 RepID=UPI0003786F9B|nr:hypothetical protein [Uliginosibacterium gangwonense]
MSRPTLARLRQILDRQAVRRWGAEYQPATRFSIGELPSESRPSALRSALVGRDIVTLSLPERAAALVALHNPNLFDLQEQRMLEVCAAPHPLVGHPTAIGCNLLPLRGTLEIASEKGWLTRHAKTWDQNNARWLPFPFLGDLLLFLRDDNGPYCINWTVKKRAEDFVRSPFAMSKKSERNTPQQSVLQRHEIESEFYADAGIPTHQITLKTFDKTFVSNLLNLILWHNRSTSIEPASSRYDEAVEFVRQCIDTDTPQYEIAKRLAAQFSCPVQEDAKPFIKQVIWHRVVRVDLFQTLGDNIPLCSEIFDPFVRYAALFARGAHVDR